MRRLCSALILTLLVASTANAHFAWLVCDKSDEGQTVKVYFSEVLSPGSAHLVENFADATIVATCAKGKCHEIATKLVEDGDEGSLDGMIPDGIDRLVEMEMTYGVHKDMLVNYYAKALIAKDGNCNDASDDSAPALNVTSKKNGNQIDLAVTWEGKPAPGESVMVLSPGAKPERLKTDDQGRLTLDATNKGRYGFLITHIENEKSGEHQGEKYSRVGNFCTLTMNLDGESTGDKAAADEKTTASDLLSNARSTRNVWEEGFPGFTADVAVTIGTDTINGKLTVNDEGEVTWDLPEGEQTKWAKSTVGSLVSHRIPSGELGDKASYADDVKNHPLGRKISLDQDSMGSVYRVKDNVIRQVNRDAGPSRFTITVLDVQRDERHRYLPTTFLVTSWNKKSGDLDFSLVAQHTFKRVGTYDLPKKLVEVTTGPKDKYEVKELVLSNLKLSTNQVSAKTDSK